MCTGHPIITVPHMGCPHALVVRTLCALPGYRYVPFSLRGPSPLPVIPSRPSTPPPPDLSCPTCSR